MPLFLALTAVGALSFQFRQEALDRACVGVLAAAVLVRLSAIGVAWRGYAEDFAQFQTVAAAIPAGALVDDARFAPSRPDVDLPRCAMYSPMLVALRDDATPLFANEGQQPLRIIGPLNAALNALHVDVDHHHFPLRYAEALVQRAGSAGFGYLLVCNTEGAPWQVPPKAQVLARTSKFTALRLAAD
jgi:hypothetical protein